MRRQLGTRSPRRWKPDTWLFDPIEESEPLDFKRAAAGEDAEERNDRLAQEREAAKREGRT